MLLKKKENGQEVPQENNSPKSCGSSYESFYLEKRSFSLRLKMTKHTYAESCSKLERVKQSIASSEKVEAGLLVEKSKLEAKSLSNLLKWKRKSNLNSVTQDLQIIRWNLIKLYKERDDIEQHLKSSHSV